MGMKKTMGTDNENYKLLMMIVNPYARRNMSAAPELLASVPTEVASERSLGANHVAESRLGDPMVSGPAMALMIWPAWRKAAPNLPLRSSSLSRKQGTQRSAAPRVMSQAASTTEWRRPFPPMETRCVHGASATRKNIDPQFNNRLISDWLKEK